MAIINKDQFYELAEIENLVGLPLHEVLKKDALAGKLIIKKDYKRQQLIYKGKVVTGKNVLRYLTSYYPRLIKKLGLESVTDEDCKNEDLNMYKEELECLKYQQQEYSKLLKVIETKITTTENKLKNLEI